MYVNITQYIYASFKLQNNNDTLMKHSWNIHSVMKPVRKKMSDTIWQKPEESRSTLHPLVSLSEHLNPISSSATVGCSKLLIRVLLSHII